MEKAAGNATRRASDMVRFLKEMARLKAFTSRSETITLAHFARELQGELQQLHPGRQFDFSWQWSVPTIIGDGRVYVRAVLELCAGFLSSDGKKCRLFADSSQQGQAIELTFHLDERKERPPAPCNPEMVDQRMELILARQWLALCGAGVEIKRPDGAMTAFTIVVPNR